MYSMKTDELMYSMTTVHGALLAAQPGSFAMHCSYISTLRLQLLGLAAALTLGRVLLPAESLGTPAPDSGAGLGILASAQ